MPDYSEDVKACESLIAILEGQIERMKNGKGFLFPGTTPQDCIESWETKIKEHRELISFLQMGGKNL